MHGMQLIDVKQLPPLLPTLYFSETNNEGFKLDELLLILLLLLLLLIPPGVGESEAPFIPKAVLSNIIAV